MTLSFIRSQKGKKILKQNGFLYEFRRKNCKEIVWRCCKRSYCDAKTYTTSMEADGVYKYVYRYQNLLYCVYIGIYFYVVSNIIREDNHEQAADCVDVEVRKARNKIKRK